MTLRTRILLPIACLFLALLAGIWVATQTVLLRGFERIERTALDEHVDRARNAILRCAEELSRTCVDWAHWDDTLEFVRTDDPEYVSSNLGATSLISAGVASMTFYGPDGSVRFDVRVVGEEEVEENSGLAANFPASFLEHEDADDLRQGLLPAGDELLVAAVCPITDSEVSGPIGGTLVQTTRLDAERLQEISEQVRLDIRVHRVGSDLPGDVGAIAESLSSGQATIEHQILDEDRIAGFGMIPDILGNPLLIVRVEVPRREVRVGLATMQSLLISYGAAALVAGIAVLLLLERTVIRRLMGIAAGVSRVERTRDVRERVPVVGGRDELAGLAIGINRMLESLEDYEIWRRDADRALQKLALVASHTASGVLITDSSGRVEWLNSAFERITGQTSADLFGQLVGPILVGPETCRRDLAKLRRQARDGGGHGIELRLRRRDGTSLWLSTEVRQAPDPGGGEARYIVVLNDVTERRRLLSDLADSRDAALEAARLKSEFLACMSHEIRTPLNGVLGMNRLMLETRLDDDQRDMSRAIESSGEALLAVIDDILDFSKIEAGRLSIEHIAMNPVAVIDDVATLFAAKAHEKGLELITYVGRDVPRAVIGDPHRTRQVLNNLVSNALKFTSEGAVELRLTRAAVDEEDSGDDEATLLFEVVDTGIGISADVLPRLFQPFTQADGSTTRRFGGTGLGLAISRQLAQLMGGEASCDSEPGAGSRFHFTIRTGRAPQPRRQVRDQHVLLLVGRKEASEALHERLVFLGCHVTVADHLDRALAAEPRPDLCLVDGPSPAISALVDAGHRVVALLRYGATGSDDGARHTTRPLGEASLRRILAEVQRGDEAAPTADAVGDPEAVGPGGPAESTGDRDAENAAERIAGEEPGAPLTPRRRADRDAVHVLLAEDNVVNQKVAIKSLERVGCRVDLATNGLEAIEAIRRHDYDLVLMDCSMPELDGFGATQQIRAWEEEGGRDRLPIVALTANAIRGDRERCLAAGMDDYLAKPFRLDDIASIVKRWCGPVASEDRDGGASGARRGEMQGEMPEEGGDGLATSAGRTGDDAATGAEPEGGRR